MKIKTTNSIQTIISGGQSGVDRAALVFSIEQGIGHSGHCPAGRWAEDGKIDKKFKLTETESADPAVRTHKNVEISDATLILILSSADEGTKLTIDICKNLNKPHLIIELNSYSESHINNWFNTHQITRLNIAGSRESNSPGIYNATLEFLETIKELF